MTSRDQSTDTKQMNSFYNETVEKIVKTKLDKFTYGGEVEIGGVLPVEEESEYNQERKIKAILKKGVVKSKHQK